MFFWKPVRLRREVDFAHWRWREVSEEKKQLLRERESSEENGERKKKTRGRKYKKTEIGNDTRAWVNYMVNKGGEREDARVGKREGAAEKAGWNQRAFLGFLSLWSPVSVNCMLWQGGTGLQSVNPGNGALSWAGRSALSTVAGPAWQVCVHLGP